MIDVVQGLRCSSSSSKSLAAANIQTMADKRVVKVPLVSVEPEIVR